jgi:pimeloyl-ACP methyl ester carboxylesterase
VLVVWGDADKILPATHYDAARSAFPDAQGHLFPDTGHMPQIEKAAEFVQVVGDFVAKVEAGR